MQVLALFSKAVKKMFQMLHSSEEAAVERTLPQVDVAALTAHLKPHALALDADLEQGAREWQANQNARLAALDARSDALDPSALEQYAIKGGSDMFEKELGGAAPVPGVVQVKGTEVRATGEAVAAKAPAALYKKGDKNGKKRQLSAGGDGGKKKKHG